MNKCIACAGIDTFVPKAAVTTAQLLSVSCGLELFNVST